VDHGGKELFYQPLGGYQNYNFDFFRTNMQHPNIMFGLSDGGAHCGVIADAGMPTFILTHWARDRTKGEQLPSISRALVRHGCRVRNERPRSSRGRKARRRT
jgi:N-acyl-D-aspartate/D-glutamate deacylase